MPFVASTVVLSENVSAILTEISKKRAYPANLIERSIILLNAARGDSNAMIAKSLGISPNVVSKWRMRYVERYDYLRNVEQHASDKLLYSVLELLNDAPRSGRHSRFTQEQVVQIYDIACKKPEDFGVVRSQWSYTALAEYVNENKIVEISRSQLWRLLDRADIKPFRIKYWLNSPEKADSPETFMEKINEICGLYHSAPEEEAKNSHVVSGDEMTGTQALERRFPDKPVMKGVPMLREFEYIRHGTTSVIAFMNVGTGKVFPPYMNTTRTEVDFVNAVRDVVQTDPDAKWTFIVDGLNTHKSESLVRFVANQIGIDENTLGEKGKTGILQSMESRGEFLHCEDHRIRFVYTPKHCSWMNQIEIWFSIISRQLLKNGNFTSVENMQQRIAAFVGKYNITAKPFEWTYNGKPLVL